MSRPRWMQEVDRPLVFWLTSGSESLMTQLAPDFYRFRSASFQFVSDEAVAPDRARELRARLKTINAKPATRLQWWLELWSLVGGKAINEAASIACQEDLKLPECDFSKVRGLSVHGYLKRLTPLAAFSRLREIYFYDSDLNPASFSKSALEDLVMLQSLEEVRVSLDSQGFATLITALSKVKNLEALFLSHSGSNTRRINASEIAELKSIRRLNRLYFIRYALDRNALESIGSFELLSLGLIQSSFDSEYLEVLPTTLVALHLTNCLISEKSAAQIKRLGSIELLNLGGSTLSLDGSPLFSSSSNISRLFLFNCGLTSGTLKSLSLPASTMHLDLDDNLLNDSASEILLLMPNLRLLRVRRNAFSPAGIEGLKKAMPHCKIRA